MAIKSNILGALNRQVNNELYSSYLYLSMSAYFESNNLKGFAHWMKIQADEEREHAMKIFDYIIQRGGKILLSPIEKPTSEWASPLAVFEDVYKHEQKITGMINNLVDLAKSENDHATGTFLGWFVNEQTEEEATAEEILQKIKYVGDSNVGLFMIDQDLGKRK